MDTDTRLTETRKYLVRELDRLTNVIIELQEELEAIKSDVKALKLDRAKRILEGY